MQLNNVLSTSAITPVKSVRYDEIRAITSAKAGKVIPLSYVPLLREDRVSRGKLRVRFEMMETAETLMNAVNVTVYAHFIPFLAFDRFNGLDQLNRSYMGEPESEGGNVVPFFVKQKYKREREIHQVMGLHAVEDELINSAPVEAYNVLVNYRRKMVSQKLPPRDNYEFSLARCFWKNTAMRSIVPDFDQAAIDGEVNLNLAGKLPVTGLGKRNSTFPQSGVTVNETGGGTRAYAKSNYIGDQQTNGEVHVEEDPDNPGFPGLFAELSQANVTLSLSNIELAKKTAWFAKMRKKYSGHDDDYIIDLLMEAIRVPDAQMAQPQLLDKKSTIFGMSKRFATDADNLAKSVTTGETFVDLNFRTPPMNTGGIILVTAEIVPEILFERQMDHFLYTSEVDQLPNFTRDYLDPEKVAVVPNRHVDVLHSKPEETFGYDGLNYMWNRSVPRIGGKFKRLVGDPFTEDRQRIWGQETIDPELTEDFYLCSDLHHNVFADTQSDAFEITTIGNVEIIGNTVFGKRLEENTGDYKALSDQVDDGRIDQDE